MEENFEELLRQSEERAVHRVNVGQKLPGLVVAVSKGSAFVDIGMRSEAQMPINEADERYTQIEEGQDIDVYVTKVGGQIEVGLDPVMGHGDFSALEAAHQAGEPIEGKVSSVISGGYEVNVAGVRCFCPHSQIDLRAPSNPGEMVGKTFKFKVLEVEVRKKNVVLSRRRLLEAEREKNVAEVRAKLVPGAVLTGRVADIQHFGAFIDFGGLQGLLHISQLAYQNVQRVEDVLSLNDEVDVKVLDITLDNRGKERISLSRKALLPNPWDDLPFERGTMVEGKIARKSNFGIFITVAPSIDGLLPKRMMKKAGRNVDMDQFEEGNPIEVEVVEINHHDRKITLALPGWDEEVRSDLQIGEHLQAEVVKVLGAGVIVQALEDPARGLIPKRTLKQSSPRQLARDFPVGAKVNVILTEIDDRGRFNFALKTETNEADGEMISRFTDEENLGHNPFANFFNND
ncbi:MAG: S1 RNA-binding domain-containing protein [Acidobacteriota bacterium]|nr:S1 RNA-binding domain-containing protein [Acidobacteriota bacterium]